MLGICNLCPGAEPLLKISESKDILKHSFQAMGAYRPYFPCHNLQGGSRIYHRETLSLTAAIFYPQSAVRKSEKC
jgi:hypothetical protein